MKANGSTEDRALAMARIKVVTALDHPHGTARLSALRSKVAWLVRARFPQTPGRAAHSRSGGDKSGRQHPRNPDCRKRMPCGRRSPATCRSCHEREVVFRWSVV